MRETPNQATLPKSLPLRLRPDNVALLRHLNQKRPSQRETSYELWSEISPQSTNGTTTTIANVFRQSLISKVTTFSPDYA